MTHDQVRSIGEAQPVQPVEERYRTVERATTALRAGPSQVKAATAQRFRLGEPFSSPSPIVLVTMLHFSRITVRDTLPECIAFFEQWKMFL
jgi:hypothetical protein